MKKISKLFLVLFMILTLTACEKGGANPASGSAQESQESEQASSESAQESQAEGQTAQQEKKSTMELYEGFLAGEVRLHPGKTEFGVMDYSTDKVTRYFVPLVDDDGYTLKEFVGRVHELERNAWDESLFVSGVYYAYVDLGRDGEKELALQIVFDGGVWGSAGAYVFLLKNVDGELQITQRLEDRGNSSGYLWNPYGLVLENGYGEEGEYVHYCILDANGEKHPLYTISYYYGMGADYGIEDGIPAAAHKIAQESGEDYLFSGIELEGYYFGDCEEEETEMYSVYTYSAYWYDDNGEEAPLPEDLKKKVEQAFQDAGQKCYTKEQIQELIRQRYLSLGIGKDVEVVNDQEDVAWDELEKKDYWYGKAVTVKNVDELMDAIANNTEIILEPGTYDLTKWLTDGNHLTKVPQYNYGEDYQGDNPVGIVYNGCDMDDYEIVFNRLNSLTLVSKDANNPARIVCDCPHAQVISFENCSNVQVENLIFGHEIEPGYCSGDVLGFGNCYEVKLKDCDLYGCGAYGLTLENTYGISVEGGKIHDCTYGCMRVSSCGWVSITDMKFVDCKEYDMFSIYGSTVDFTGCTFRNLQGEMLYLCGGSGYANFWNCQFDAAALDSIRGNEYFESCVNME